MPLAIPCMQAIQKHRRLPRQLCTLLDSILQFVCPIVCVSRWKSLTKSPAVGWSAAVSQGDLCTSLIPDALVTGGYYLGGFSYVLVDGTASHDKYYIKVRYGMASTGRESDDDTLRTRITPRQILSLVHDSQ